MLVGSEHSVKHVNSSLAIQKHIFSGKLEFRRMILPDTYHRMDENGSTVTYVHEITNRILTDITFYNDVISPAESLFVFNSDSVLCANSNSTIDDWLLYDWVAASEYVIAQKFNPVRTFDD